jgi:hypothetical protein
MPFDQAPAIFQVKQYNYIARHFPPPYTYKLRRAGFSGPLRALQSIFCPDCLDGSMLVVTDQLPTYARLQLKQRVEYFLACRKGKRSRHEHPVFGYRHSSITSSSHSPVWVVSD